jgi:hypothetical protein
LRYTQHPSNNDVLGAPPGVTAEDCRALPITRVMFTNGIPAVWSYWRPSPAEREAIAAGGLVQLSIWGRTHSPVHVSVDGVAEEPGEEAIVAPPDSISEARVNAIHSHPYVRSCLLEYHDRPCDKEAAAVVRCIANALTGNYLGAPAATQPLDVAGIPKPPLSALEKLAVDACNLVKAWAESDRRAPFPEEAHMLADGVLMMAAQRRAGVQ